MTDPAGNDRGRRSITFRTRLVLFGLAVSALVALPALVLEVRRPWVLLDDLIGRGDAVLAGLRAGVDTDEIARMNEFALGVARDAPDLDEDYLIWSFNLLALSGSLPSEADLKAGLVEAEAERRDFDYAGVEEAFEFWTERLAASPGMLELFSKSKRRLMDTNGFSGQLGFEYQDVYIMVDSGEVFGFLVDGSDWADSTYPGLPYDTSVSHDEYWRAYREKGPGFDHNPRFYHFHLFPKFDTDKWGSWFTVWLAEKNGAVYNAYCMDFDAGAVKGEMWRVAGAIVGVAAVLALIIGVVTRKLSRTISVPIQYLIEGTEAVIKGDYNHVVPTAGGREFERPIRTMNQMIRHLKERVNMMQTLEKLLSKELAEQVAKHGLVLGGRKVDITNVFTDFAGFSSITRELEPGDVVAMLNDYFEALIPIIKKWGGLPDKYIGDAIVAIFGAPIQLENHAEHAVGAAIEMQQAMGRINTQRRAEGKIVLEMRIGLNSGDVIAGAMGSDMKLEYTTIGETTNLANRMEANAEIGHILVAENTFEKIKHIFFEGALVSQTPQYIQVKGYNRPVACYSIHVSEFIIAKNEHAPRPEDFYTVTRVERDLTRKFSDLDPETAARFTKTLTF